MRDFSFCYDTYLNLEEPELYLANPNKSFISNGAIKVKELSSELYFNNISSISFSCSYIKNGIINIDYKNIIEGNLILAKNIGWFQITEAKESGIGINKTKSIKALSLENEFCNKNLTSFGSMGKPEDWDGGLDTYFLWNELLPDKSILNIVLKKMPAWKIGYIDPTITTQPRSFNVDKIDAYTFLTKNVSEAFDCIFIFNTFEMSINAYNPDNIGKLTNLYFSHHNLIKVLDKDINLKDIKTVLYVQGGEYGTTNLDITEVNPTHSNLVSNWNYFKPRMSSELQRRLDDYDVEYKKRQELHQKYLVTDKNSLSKLYEKLADLINRVPALKVNDFNKRLIELEEEINNEKNIEKKEVLRKQYINLVNEKIKFLEKQEEYMGTEWALYGSVELKKMFDSYNGVLSLFAGKSDKISLQMYNDAYKILYGENGIVANQKIRENEIENCKNKISETKKKLEEVSIDIRKFLGEKLYKELSHYIYEDVFTDTNIIVTSDMTDFERLEMEKELYQESLKQLKKVSKPNPTFTLDSMDFTAIKNFIPLTENIKLGDFAIIELEENTNISPSETMKVRLLKIAIDWWNNDFSLTFSSTTQLEEGLWGWNEIKEQAQSTSDTINLNGSGWNYSANQSSFVRDFMLNPLNAALNKLKSSNKEEVVIDNSGIHCREHNSDTNTYSDEQLWITRNLICFSNDAFNTVCTALGKVTVNGKELYGLVAQYLYGSLIAGQNLIISNDNGSFVVNGDGVSITNLDLEIENDHYKIQLGNMNNTADDDIFTIWKKDGSSLTKQMYFNNGDLTITGLLNALSGSKFGNWVIGVDSIYYKHNEFGNVNGMYFGINGISVGKFKVDSYGNMYTVNGDYSGRIVSSEGQIGGWTITSSGLSGDGTIDGGTIRGAYINANNSYFTNATLNSCNVIGDLTANDANITVTSSITGNQMRLSQGKLVTNGTIGIYNNDIYCDMIYIRNTSTGFDKVPNGQSITAYINEVIDKKLSKTNL